MRNNASIVLLAAVLALPACVEPDPTDSLAQGDTVISPSIPRAWCEGCDDRHEVGEPVTIHTTYSGSCGLPGWEHDCMEQAYSLAIHCTGGCTLNGPTEGYGQTGADVEVTPLSTGFIAIYVDMDDAQLTMGPFRVLRPDRITCHTNWSICGDGTLQLAPVRVDFVVKAGDESIYPQPELAITSDARGRHGGNYDWVVDAYGRITVAAAYKDLATEVELLVTPAPIELDPADVDDQL